MAPFYRAPSKARLMEALAIDSDQADKVRGLLHGSIKWHTVPEAKAFFDSCYNKPSHIEVLMEALNAVIGTHGVEFSGADSNDPFGVPAITYLNAGATYNTTIVYKHGADTFQLIDWGTIAERMGL